MAVSHSSIPDDLGVLLDCGRRLATTNRFEEAVAAFQRAAALAPDQADVRMLLGAALVSADRPAEALPHLRHAVAQRPELPLVHTNLGTAFQALNASNEALACYEAALAVAPDDPLAHFNRAISWLTIGDYRRGWPEFEWRWRCSQFFGRSLVDDPRRWDGSPLAGRTLLVYTEQGLGDAIQMLRFVPAIRAAGGRVVVRCGPTLATLLREAAIADAVVTEDDPLPAIDVHAAVMSLPWLLRVTLEGLPGATPYLSVGAARRAAWRERLARIPGRRLGVCWKGNPTHPRDGQRSIGVGWFEQMAPRLDDVTLVSLLHEKPATDVPGAAIRWLTDVHEGPIDLADVAAALLSLDGVVTVDTVIAHLAGALGVRVWILLPFFADWRWMLDRPDTPWYPTARLIRQPRRGDWVRVFQSVTAELASATPI